MTSSPAYSTRDPSTENRPSAMFGIVQPVHPGSRKAIYCMIQGLRQEFSDVRVDVNRGQDVLLSAVHTGLCRRLVDAAYGIGYQHVGGRNTSGRIPSVCARLETRNGRRCVPRESTSTHVSVKPRRRDHRNHVCQLYRYLHRLDVVARQLCRLPNHPDGRFLDVRDNDRPGAKKESIQEHPSNARSD